MSEAPVLGRRSLLLGAAARLFAREAGVPRRPLPFDQDLRPKPAYRALSNALTSAPRHHPSWPITRHVAGASA